MRTEGGVEIDIERIDHFCQLVVITPAQEVTDDIPGADLEPYRDVLEEFDALTPGTLRQLIEAHNE